MTKIAAKLSPQGHTQLEQFGARIKAARLRRNLPQALVAERAGISLMTYRSAESGASGCALGTYLAILEVLGLSQDLNLVAQEDQLGRNLQDGALKSRASMRPMFSASADASGFYDKPTRDVGHVASKDLTSTIERNKSASKLAGTVLSNTKGFSRDELMNTLVKPKRKD